MAKALKYVAIPAIIGAVGLGSYLYFTSEEEFADEPEEKSILIKILRQRKRNLLSIANYYSHLYQDQIAKNNVKAGEQNAKVLLRYFNSKSISKNIDSD